MNPLVLQFANGNVFFIGMGMVIAASALCLRVNGRLLRSLATVAWLVGICFVVLSATPLSPLIYATWFGVCTVGFVVLILRARSGTAFARRTIVASNVLLTIVLVFLELPFHLTPSVTVSLTQPVFVIGDSISAGVSSKERTWPQVLAERTRLTITNLARPGATVGSALKQCARIDRAGALILVETGGNDLLGGTDIHEFHQQLDQLLGNVSVGGNQVVMFEIPLFPFKNAFGLEQRILAKKYRATLLPKRFLTGVFGTEGATLDGLHLSQGGHDALAAEIQGILRIR